MELPLWMKISMALVLGFMVFRLWPAAMHQMKHGPKGSSQDWQAALLPLLMVIGFVVLLVLMVR
ncbi:MAG: hypothetical protein V3W04_00340 [Gammaproteobacteria bacterium]